MKRRYKQSDAGKESNRKYTNSHKLQISRTSKEWSIKNRKRVRANQRAWKNKNPQKCLDYSKKWRENNKEKVCITSERRRTRKLGIDNQFSLSEWMNLLDKYNHKCLCCGTSHDLQPDHVIPLALDGKNTIDNIQPLCGKCNRKKYTQIIDFREIPNVFLPL